MRQETHAPQKLSLCTHPFSTKLISIFLIIGVGFALFAEHYLGVLPCHYCLYQRYIFLGAALFFLFNHTFWLGFFILFSGLALSFYQIGLEQHLWTDFLGKCSALIPSVDNTTDLKKLLKASPIVRCDQINWRIFGISAVIWTSLFQVVLLLLALTYRLCDKDPFEAETKESKKNSSRKKNKNPDINPKEIA